MPDLQLYMKVVVYVVVLQRFILFLHNKEEFLPL